MDKRRIGIISGAAALVLAGLTLLIYNSVRAKVIPRGKMAKIYAEMLMADQWINSHSRYSRMADTTYVYRPILEKYGYDEKDWRASVARYIEDPDRYGRMIKKATNILGARRSELEAEKSRLEAWRQIQAHADMWKPERVFYLGGMRNPDNAAVGGLVFYVDTVGGSEWRFDPFRGYDTLASGAAWEISLKETPDSLEFADGLAVPDTLGLKVPADSLSVAAVPVDSTDGNAPEALPVRTRSMKLHKGVKIDSSAAMLEVKSLTDDAKIQ